MATTTATLTLSSADLSSQALSITATSTLFKANTTIGLDHSSLQGSDPCLSPIKAFIVKTRSSASFTSQLKDFAGPYRWGDPYMETNISSPSLIACDNPIVTLQADPVRTDATYLWTTVDGNILTDPSLTSIDVNQPGTYTLSTNLASTSDEETAMLFQQDVQNLTLSPA